MGPAMSATPSGGVRARPKRLESRDIPILLLGESGTGKEFFARALHAASDRADKPFVAVNCGSLPEMLMHNELFGRAGGSTEDERGRIAPLLFHLFRVIGHDRLAHQRRLGSKIYCACKYAPTAH